MMITIGACQQTGKLHVKHMSKNTSDSCMPDYPPFQKDPETFPRQTSQTDH